MIFRQLFERESSTYTYLLASGKGGEALLLDPVKEEVPKYLQILKELDVRLVFALDTHVHADHITALGSLRDSTACATLMGEQSRAECVSRKVGLRPDVSPIPTAVALTVRLVEPSRRGPSPERVAATRGGTTGA